MTRPPARLVTTAGLVLGLALAGCSAGAGDAPDPGETTPRGSGPTATAPDLPTGPVDLDLSEVTDRLPPASCLFVSGAGEPTAIRIDEPLTPASAMKLVTADVALAVLDVEQRLADDTVGAAIRAALRDSDNDAARALTEMIGAETAGEATVEAGVAAFVPTLQRSGTPVEGLRAVDGWGLSHDNRATCATLHSILSRHGPDSTMGRSLAVAGTSGTVADRFPEAAGRLQVKTGSIRGVVALAGFLAGQSGEVQFTMLVNGVPDGEGAALQDLLVATLAEQVPGSPGRS